MRIKRSGLVNLFKIGANRAGPDLRSAVVDIVESSMGIVHGPDMNTLPPPPPPWGFWKTVIFGHIVMWLFNICFFALKILGHKKILGH